MELADQAMLALRQGDTERARGLNRSAFDKERKAASIVAPDLNLEPTRSVLHRSAASLALDCGEIREAERLIGTALAGNPPEQIADELRDLIEDVHFQRHLAVRGVTLGPHEFQLSLEGAGVGFGIAPSDFVITRVRDIETLIYRTAERKLGQEFREAGRRRKKLADEMELYVTVPRAASFAWSFRIGKTGQTKIPEMDFPRDVIDDLFDCIDLFNKNSIDELRRHIPDDPYFRNFIGLVRKIAPDGDSVRSIGLTTTTKGAERRVVLSVPQREVKIEQVLEPAALPALIHLQGILLAADARGQSQGRIEIVDDDGISHHVKVARGMMSDIVRPMFEQKVLVTGRQEHDLILLDAIEPAEDQT